MPHKCRVLIVDDDVEWLEVLGEVLRTAGYSVAAAEDGHRGLEMIAALKPSVVTTDLQMPLVGGRRLLAEARAADSRLPVIVLSADAGANAVTLPGAFRIIRKPCEPEVILATVADALAHRAERLPLQKLWRAASGRAAVDRPTSIFGGAMSAAISYFRSKTPQRFVLVTSVLLVSLFVRKLIKA
jgi:DNA-binding NtrC family response regulator